MHADTDIYYSKSHGHWSRHEDRNPSWESRAHGSKRIRRRRARLPGGRSSSHRVPTVPWLKSWPRPGAFAFHGGGYGGWRSLLTPPPPPPNECTRTRTRGQAATRRGRWGSKHLTPPGSPVTRATTATGVATSGASYCRPGRSGPVRSPRRRAGLRRKRRSRVASPSPSASCRLAACWHERRQIHGLRTSSTACRVARGGAGRFGLWWKRGKPLRGGAGRAARGLGR
jgi:hypothetical protein